MKKTLKSLIFKLTLCQGIGNLSILRIIAFAKKHHYVNFSEEEIIKIAQINHYESIFRHSWSYLSQSKELVAEKTLEQSFLTIVDDCYPTLLLEIYNSPAILFYKGDLSYFDTPAIAFVGARNATNYGKKVVQQLIPPLVQKDITIVSGAAKGIDSFSHEAAIAAKGRTIAVVGTGLDHYYPKETADLQHLIAQNHLLLSEYPNGTTIKKYHFPMRNRIIAGLTLGTCVIEAKKRSGSLITAQSALEYNREVFSVPSGIFAKESAGCLELIQSGAKCLICATDILEEINYF